MLRGGGEEERSKMPIKMIAEVIGGCFIDVLLVAMCMFDFIVEVVLSCGGIAMNPSPLSSQRTCTLDTKALCVYAEWIGDIYLVCVCLAILNILRNVYYCYYPLRPPRVCLHFHPRNQRLHAASAA